MHGDYRPGVSRDGDYQRFVEFSAGNMHPGITGRFKSAEREKTVLLTRNGFGDFGGSGFDAAAMQKNQWQVTFSIGLATYRAAPGSVDESIKAADELMYHAKHNGKNTIRHAVLKT